jgi:hypothetical protein
MPVLASAIFQPGNAIGSFSLIVEAMTAVELSPNQNQPEKAQLKCNPC